MKIYIAGKITGEKHYKKKFDAAEKALKKKGHSCMNPACLGNYPDFSYKNYMDITRAMQDVCDAVYFIPGWEGSNGANKEYYHALEKGQRRFFDLGDVPKA